LLLLGYIDFIEFIYPAGRETKNEKDEK